MPSKYVVRNFTQGGLYHIYNRGIDNREIFTNEKDYSLFLYYLSAYLMPVEKVLQLYRHLPPRLFSKNLSKEVTLISYSLLPTHFHFILQQESKNGISKFMKQLTNAYTQYFNHHYHHTGAIFDGRYKAASIASTEALMLTSRYIILAPQLLSITSSPEYQWSSYNEFIEPTRYSLCNTQTLLSLFPSIYAYKKFHSDIKGYSKSLNKILPITIDSH